MYKALPTTDEISTIKGEPIATSTSPDNNAAPRHACNG